jgi:hypothetical protein
MAKKPKPKKRQSKRSHRRNSRLTLDDLLAKEGVPLPAERAREMILLMEGAVSLMLIHGDRSYAEAAARAAQQLVKSKR